MNFQTFVPVGLFVVSMIFIMRNHWITFGPGELKQGVLVTPFSFLIASAITSQVIGTENVIAFLCVAVAIFLTAHNYRMTVTLGDLKNGIFFTPFALYLAAVVAMVVF